MNPPRLATLLLKWFGLAHDEPFAGDLVEEFQSGRTAGWFWRQTLAAVLRVVLRTVCRADVLPVIVGYGIVTPATVLFLQIYGPIDTQWTSRIVVALIVIAGIVSDSRVPGRGMLGQTYGIMYALVPANAVSFGGVAVRVRHSGYFRQTFCRLRRTFGALSSGRCQQPGKTQWVVFGLGADSV